jgi:hypothetical protein
MAEVVANHRRLANGSAEVVKGGEIAKQRAATSGTEKCVVAKPVRGVVLEFATRMRQSRGREVLLNG